jgi:Secretion system C-terminal sorting domain
MKQCYPKVPGILAILTLLFYLPASLNAQCLCENGNAPQTVTYQQTRNIRPIDDSTTFDLLQFNPTLGQLTCVNVFSFITGIVRMRLENDEIYPVNYRIGYNRTDQIQGPGLTPAITNTFSKNYGPYSLAASDGAYFSGPDFVAIGPDSVLKNRYLNRNLTGGLAPFLGYGNLQYNYKVTGRTTVTGSINYIFSVSSQDIVTVGITYSFCPTALLAAGIKDFAAAKRNQNDVYLSWTTVNELKSNKYEIEISKNNSEFVSIGQVQANTVNGSTSSKYEYPYHLSQATAGNLYFRVKQINSAGKAVYSPVKLVSFIDSKAGFSIYPNPVRNKVQLQFENAINGDFKVDIVNIAGQVIFSRDMKLKETSVLSIELPETPAPGVYYLRAKDVNSSKTYSGKLIVQSH